MDVRIFLKKLSKAKLGKYIPSGFSVSTILSSKEIENNNHVYRGNGCLKKSESLRDEIRKINHLLKKWIWR